MSTRKLNLSVIKNLTVVPGSEVAAEDLQKGSRYWILAYRSGGPTIFKGTVRQIVHGELVPGELHKFAVIEPDDLEQYTNNGKNIIIPMIHSRTYQFFKILQESPFRRRRNLLYIRTRNATRSGGRRRSRRS